MRKNLKLLSIFIVTCIGIIILAIFVFAGNNIFNKQITSQDVIEEIENISDEDNLFTSGKITLGSTRIDYTVYNTENKKKAVLDIFSNTELVYGMEYYELNGDAYVYLANEKKYVTLPYKFENEGRLIDIAKGTLVKEKKITVEYNEYRWSIQPSEFIDVLVNEFDNELDKLLQDIKSQLFLNDEQLKINDGNYDNVKSFLLNEVLTSEPINIKIFKENDGLNMNYLINTTYGTMIIDEINKQFNDEIEIREIEEDKVIPFENY